MRVLLIARWKQTSASLAKQKDATRTGESLRFLSSFAVLLVALVLLISLSPIALPFLPSALS